MSREADRVLRAIYDAPSDKHVFDGTQRACAPEQTLERVTPFLQRAGITRVANITGLDRIGIPVCMAIRPNSRSLSVFQGKGATIASAKASAIMEAFETHLAEWDRPGVVLESYRRLKRRRRVVDLERLAGAPEIDPDRPLAWISGVDLLARETVWVPYELVHANFTEPSAPGGGCFAVSTNGLASGNSLAEAVCHGVAEVIERDEMSRHEQRSEAERDLQRVALDTIRDPFARSLLDQLERAEIAVALWTMSTELGVPAFRALISDRTSDQDLRPVPAAFGAGAHVERDVAITRALTEAAQSRLTAIAGARDDMTRSSYLSTQSAAALAKTRQLTELRRGGVDVASIASLSTTTFAGDLEAMLARLRRRGLERAVVVDLSHETLPIAAARVIVPGLASIAESRSSTP